MVNYMLNSEVILGLAKLCLDFLGKPSPKDYAQAVHTIHNPDVMHKILETRISDIEKDSQLSRDEKESYKDKILDHYMAADIRHIHASADTVDRDTENRIRGAYYILGGMLAGSVTFGTACYVAKKMQNNAGQIHIVPRTNS